MRGAKAEGFEYRVRYRREYGREKAKTFGQLRAARRYVHKVKNYDSGDPMFEADRLIFIRIDRRPVGQWDREWEDPQR